MWKRSVMKPSLLNCMSEEVIMVYSGVMYLIAGCHAPSASVRNRLVSMQIPTVVW